MDSEVISCFETSHFCTSLLQTLYPTRIVRISGKNQHDKKINKQVKKISNMDIVFNIYTFCSSGDAPARWRVRLGSTNANSGGIVYNTQLIINHAQYDPRNYDNDIAIVRVASTIVFSNVIRAGSYAGPNFVVPDNAVVWATGWGRTAVSGFFTFV